MQNNPGNERYEEGKAALEKLVTAARLLKSQELMSSLDHVHATYVEHSISEKFSQENALLNSRNIFNEKLIEHEARHDAFLSLSSQYKALGLEGDAHAYEARAQMESSTVRGFQAVKESCDREIETSGIQQSAEKPRTLKSHLEAARQHLEEHKNSHAISNVYAQQVAEVRTVIQQFEKEINVRPLSPDEIRQYSAAAVQHDSYVTRAEQEAVKSASFYQKFQTEMRSAERSYESLRHEKFSAAMNHDSPESPSPEKSEKNNPSPEPERVPINVPTNGHRLGLSKAEAFRQMVNEINREL